MKKSFKITSIGITAYLLAAVLIFASCKKDNGNSNPKANGIAPDSASAGNVLTLTGTDLADMRSIVFDNGNVPAGFNPNFNTSGAVIFRVPDTANGGNQNIIFTNSIGKKLTVPFKVLAYPSVTAFSNYNFTAGSQITLTGNNLADVTSVVLFGTTTAATVVSKTKSQLVIKMPATTLTRTKITITNGSGSLTPTQELVNVDQAFTFFTDGYNNGEQDAAWGNAGFISTTVFKSGTASYGKVYSQGQWHQMGFGWNGITNNNYQYFSFWIKGCSADYNLWISTDKSVGGFATFNDGDKILVPANVWTYFKIPITKLDLWSTGTSFSQIGFRIQGPNNQDETFYLDDVMLVK